MNNNELKDLIIRRGGKIINRHKFMYHNQTYYLDYFIKDWEQKNLKISKWEIKNNYKNEIEKFNEKEEKLTAWETVGGIIGFFQFEIYFIPIIMVISIPVMIYSMFGFIIKRILFSTKNNEYESLEKRVEDLEKWSKNFPEFIYKKQKPKRKLNWVFEKFIINNYAIATNQDVVLTLENYAEIKDLQKQKFIQQKKK